MQLHGASYSESMSKPVWFLSESYQLWILSLLVYIALLTWIKMIVVSFLLNEWMTSAQSSQPLNKQAV